MTALDGVLIAGVGGASLGTEVAKSLSLAGSYRIWGCDVSPHAYGLSDPVFEETALVARGSYRENLLDLCKKWDVRSVVPGGEEPLRLIVEARNMFLSEGIVVAANDERVIRTCIDKERLFEELHRLGFAIPWTVPVADPSDLDDVSIPTFPCVIKPARTSGGSALVFLVQSEEELKLFAHLITRTGSPAIVQEYVPVEEGEFTVGVLSLPDADFVGSIALRRLFDAKLSVSMSAGPGLISSGYSQGLIDDFPEVRAQAEQIAAALGGCGPLNIQGRVRDGILLPFEINPRFSASTFLRAMAGFNEIDLFLRHCLHGEVPQVNPLRPGYYLRSLTERFIPRAEP